jgi:RHS repeat-associated protein
MVASNKFVYDGWNLVAELNATNDTPLRTYAWGLDLSGTMDGAGGVGGLLWVTLHSTPQASTHFAAYDGRGNVVGLVAATTGEETARYEYGPFGDLIRATGPMALANPVRFSSKYHDDVSGLIYYGHRYYSPSQQRWLSRDPIGHEGGLNLYGFLANDPVNAVDALGLIEYWPDNWHHNALQEYRDLFKLSGIDIDQKKWGDMLPLGVHQELHGRGFNDAIAEHLFPDGQFEPTNPTKFRRFLTRDIKQRPEFKDLFELGQPATHRYGSRLSRTAKVLPVVGGLLALTSASASAESIGCHMRQFVHDTEAQEDAWAYVDALMVRHEFNQQSPFAGDVAMRSMYGWK